MGSAKGVSKRKYAVMGRGCDEYGEGGGMKDMGRGHGRMIG
jgi:hypothetical protein